MIYCANQEQSSSFRLPNDGVHKPDACQPPVYNLSKCASVILVRDSLAADQLWITDHLKWLHFAMPYWPVRVVSHCFLESVS